MLPKHNIEVLLDGVEWKELDWPGQVDGTFATHEGRLTIMGFEFRCYQLNDGQRVLNAEDVEKFLER